MSEHTSVLRLLPVPRHVAYGDGHLALEEGRLILIDGPQPASLRAIAARIQRALQQSARLNWQVVASPATPRGFIGLTLGLVSGPGGHPQGYRLEISPTGITILAHDEAGLFYGACTLAQILESPNGEQTFGERRVLPCLQIHDWPDFPARGLMLDVSRDKVPTMATLRDLVDMLASWKINQLQLYTEHTFAYQAYPEVWGKASPLTGEDILDLDEYCRERYMELVPNQNSFGHMHRWLTHPRFTHLAELTGTFSTPWGHTMEGPFSLCPIDPGSLDLVRNLYDELLPHFSSRMLNVGCDETIDVGQGRSKATCEAQGHGRVYLDFLLKVYREVRSHGRSMQFWGDIIVQHPELIPELPPDVIALEWGYEAQHAFDARGASFAASGIPFYVCPGTSTWCSIAGRTDNALGNLLNAAENGQKHGAIGYLNTDWGDRGHWQVLPVSYLGYIAGAAYSWALAANHDLDMADCVSWHGFRDATGTMGRVAYDLGNVYRAPGIARPNGAALFWALQWSIEDVRKNAVPADVFDCAEEAINRAIQPLGHVRMDHPEAELIQREYRQTAHLMKHACGRGRLAAETDATVAHRMAAGLADDMQQILPEYRAVWLARNRTGGLADSAGRLEKAAEDYAGL